MDLLTALSIGAASGAVAAVAYMANQLGRHAQMLVDHERRLALLEGHYETIGERLDSLRSLITENGA